MLVGSDFFSAFFFPLLFHTSTARMGLVKYYSFSGVKRGRKTDGRRMDEGLFVVREEKRRRVQCCVVLEGQYYLIFVPWQCYMPVKIWHTHARTLGFGFTGAGHSEIYFEIYMYLYMY